MPYNKTNKILDAISELYNINSLTIADFNKLTYEQKVVAILWCNYTNNYLSSLSTNSLNQLRTTLTDLEVKLKDKIVIENIDSLSIDLNELDNVNSINAIITKLNTLTTLDYTDDLVNINNSINNITDYTNDLSTILLKLNNLVNNNYKIDTNSLDYLVDKLITYNVPITYTSNLSNNTNTPQTLSTPVREVGDLHIASYLITVTDMTTNNLSVKVEGSIDGNNWTTVPLKYSNLTGNSNHIYTIPTNGTYLFSTEVLTKYIRLTVSNIVTAKITGQLYVK